LVEEGLLPEHMSPIVFCGDRQNTRRYQEVVEWFIRKFRSLLAKKEVLELEWKGAQGRNDSMLEYFEERVQEKAKKIWILEGGFEEFYEQFPYLCGVPFSELPPLPCLIAPGLFLGSRCVMSAERRWKGQLGLELHHLHQLGIAHVIVNADMPLSLEDAEGIKCLRCGVSDTNFQDMKDCWNVTTEFIENARAQGSRALIQVHGRSRSASICVAWTMRYMKLPFEEALEYVLSTCFYRLDTQLMYLDQLRHWLEDENARLINHE